MSIETTIYTLLNQSSVTNIVSTAIYPTDPVEGAVIPFVVYRADNEDNSISMSGVTTQTRYTLTVDLWTASVGQGTSLSNVVRNILHGYQGSNIQGMFINSDTREEIGDDTEGKVYHRVHSYTVWATTT